VVDIRQLVRLRTQKKRGLRPAFPSLNRRLLPVARNHNPAVSAPFPVMGNPDRAGMRRMRPTPMDPDVTVAVPTVVAVVPYPPVMRWMVMMLNDGRGRRNTDDDLRYCNRWCETQSEQPCQKSLFHRNHYLRGLDLPESGSLFLAISAFFDSALNRMSDVKWQFHSGVPSDRCSSLGWKELPHCTMPAKLISESKTL
jgi:hypothetical protein